MEEKHIIALSQGQETIVDASDYEWLNQWKWFANWSKLTNRFYVGRKITIEAGKQRTIWMHRQILGLERGDKRIGDHSNLDTLDNRRANLRICTHSQNRTNTSVRQDNVCGMKGVCWHKNSKKWRAQIQVDGKRKHLGYFLVVEEAHLAYSKAAHKFYGIFARD